MDLTFSLPAELREFIERAVKSGRFADEKEVVVEALETLKTREEFHQFQLAGLKEKLHVGLSDLDRGQAGEWDGESIKRQGRALLAVRLAGV